MKSIQNLLVEDNQGDVLSIKIAFQEAKIVSNIRPLNKGEKAIQFLEKSSPYKDKNTINLVLLDANLTLKKGHEVLSYVKNSDDLKQIPVIILTRADDNGFIKSQRNYDNSYPKKPIVADNILYTVNNIENFRFQLVKVSPQNLGEVYE